MSDPSSSANVKQLYRDQGYVIFRDVLDANLIGEARQHIDWLMARHPSLRPEQLGNTLMTEDPFWVRLISDERLVDIAAAFVGPDVALFASHYIAKRPRDGQAVLWHQDGSFWPLEPMEVITLWLAIDDSDQENGCMRVIPGTHAGQLLAYEEMQQQQDGQNVLGAGIDPADVDDGAAIDLILREGDVSVHHPNIIHGSYPNHSPRWRRGLTIRYIPASTRIKKPQPHVSAFMLRGEPTIGINIYNPWPEYVPGQHMPFHDAEAWNERRLVVNQTYQAVLPDGK